MITYEEYYAQQKRVERAANDFKLGTITASQCVNFTGLRDTEAFWKYAGTYQIQLAAFAQEGDFDVQRQHLTQACRILIAAIRSFGSVDFALFTEEEVMGDSVLLSCFEQRMADFCRMNPVTFMGYAAMMSNVDIFPDNTCEYGRYFQRQFFLLADYAITHGIDLEHLLCS